MFHVSHIPGIIAKRSQCMSGATMGAFSRSLDIPMKASAYVKNGAHGHCANDLHVQNSAHMAGKNLRFGRGLCCCLVCRCPSTLERDRGITTNPKRTTLLVIDVRCHFGPELHNRSGRSSPYRTIGGPMGGFQPSRACAVASLKNLQNRRGANSTRPVPRHREAPVTQARQAAPDWARARWIV